jgi:competence protein ComEC
MTHVLTISSQHVAVLGAVIYFSLRAFAAPAATRTYTTMALFWLYVLIAGASLSAIRAGVVATLVLATGLLGRRVATA